MRILVLGGTRFLGKHLVIAARRRGHHLTLFNRGKTAPSLFPDAEQRRGDRDGDLSSLEEGTWDAVVDTSGYFPRQVEATSELLTGRVGRYLFVSSISAYAETSRPGIDEDAPTAVLADPTVEEITTETYGALKAACEQVVRSHFRGGAVVVRPGLVVGPDDPTDRFAYWVARLQRGGRVLAPGPRERAVQIIDVRDLGAWIVRLLEEGQSDTYNAVGPAWPLSFGLLLLAGAEAFGLDDLDIAWVPEPDLLASGVEPWSELPLWITSEEQDVGFRADPARAIRAGLRYRPLTDTFRATRDWMDETGRLDGPHPEAWLTPERERQVLQMLAP